MRVRRSIIYTFSKSQELRKALAFLLYCKHHCGINFLNNFSYNKLHHLTGVHITTLKKRIHTLIENGLAYIKDGRLNFRKVYRQNHRNNFFTDARKFHTLKDYEYAVGSLAVAFIQAKKIFAKNVIDTCNNPSSTKAHKVARTLADVFHLGRSFKDWGTSYAFIAKSFGMSIKTAVETVKFAVKKRILKKERHVKQVKLFGVYYRLNKTNSLCTFSTRHNVYFVFANSYSLVGNSHLGTIRL